MYKVESYLKKKTSPLRSTLHRMKHIANLYYKPLNFSVLLSRGLGTSTTFVPPCKMNNNGINIMSIESEKEGVNITSGGFVVYFIGMMAKYFLFSGISFFFIPLDLIPVSSIRRFLLLLFIKIPIRTLHMHNNIH